MEGKSGSGLRGRIRLFLPVEVRLIVDCGKKRRAGEKRHYFPWEELPRRSASDVNAPTPRANPICIAREWKRAMEERGESRKTSTCGPVAKNGQSSRARPRREDMGSG